MQRLLLALLLLTACAATTPAPVAEALDVPPPAGQRALDLGPSNALSGAPGDTIRIEGQRAEIVDRRSVEGGIVLTVYVDEARAHKWLERGTVQAPTDAGGCRPPAALQ